MIVASNADKYSFFFVCFFRPDPLSFRYTNKCFLVALCRLIVGRPYFEVATKFLVSRWKHQSNFIAILQMEVCPCRFSRMCGYFRDPWVSFITKDGFSVKVMKIPLGINWRPLYSRMDQVKFEEDRQPFTWVILEYFVLNVSSTHSLLFWFWTHFSNKMKWLYYLK